LPELKSDICQACGSCRTKKSLQLKDKKSLRSKVETKEIKTDENDWETEIADKIKELRDLQKTLTDNEAINKIENIISKCWDCDEKKDWELIKATDLFK